MPSNPPTPVVKSFLICQDLIQDAASREYILIRPTTGIRTTQIPCVFRAHVYIQMTSGHGSYLPGLQLRDMDEQIIWSQSFATPFQAADPLRPCVLTIHNIGLCFPHMGKYELVFLTNEQEVARHSLWIDWAAPAMAPPAPLR